MLNYEEVNKEFIAFDQICKDNQHSLVDALFANAKVEDMPQQVMEIYLDATLGDRKKFNNRTSFYNRCIKELEKRKEKISRKMTKLL